MSPWDLPVDSLSQTRAHSQRVAGAAGGAGRAKGNPRYRRLESTGALPGASSLPIDAPGALCPHAAPTSATLTDGAPAGFQPVNLSAGKGPLSVLWDQSKHFTGQERGQPNATRHPHRREAPQVITAPGAPATDISGAHPPEFAAFRGWSS